MSQRLAGHAVVEQLLVDGVDTAFCVPGESYLPVLDGLHDARNAIQLITTRHEGGASFMAAAYGRLTGRPGVCLVTRGPGAANASIGVHAAKQDAAPMVLFVGQVSTKELGRETFQEVDYRQFFGSLAKAVLQIEHPDRVPELVARALHVAVSGRPGPVVVALPVDVLFAQTAAPAVPPSAFASGSPAVADVQRLLDLVGAASRPVLVVDGSRWTPERARDLQALAEMLSVPVVTSVRRQDMIDNSSPSYVGTLGLGTAPTAESAVRRSDCVVLLGPRPDGLTTGGSRLLEVPAPTQQVLHVHPDPDVVGSVFRADWTVTCDPGELVSAALGLAQKRPAQDWCAELRAAYEQLVSKRVDSEIGAFMTVFNEVVPEDAIISCGAGQYTAWPQQHHRYRSYPSQLASQSGAMGYGLPAAITAKLVHPDRVAVAFAGDGCLMMNGQELATAVQYGLDIVVVVVNNSSFGTIRTHQDRHFPGRHPATGLNNPDFPALARSFGATGATVTTPDEFKTALRAALNAPRPSLVEVRLA